MRSFNDYLDQMTGKIPDEAIKTLPMLLSMKTKQKMMKFKPLFIVGVINDAIREINKGSTEELEKLISKRL